MRVAIVTAAGVRHVGHVFGSGGVLRSLDAVRREVRRATSGRRHPLAQVFGDYSAENDGLGVLVDLRHATVEAAS